MNKVSYLSAAHDRFGARVEIGDDVTFSEPLGRTLVKGTMCGVTTDGFALIYDGERTCKVSPSRVTLIKSTPQRLYSEFEDVIAAYEERETDKATFIAELARFMERLTDYIEWGE